MNQTQMEQAAQQIEQRWGDYYEKAKKPRSCIYCAATRICWNGSRIRSVSVWVLSAVVYIAELYCRRVKCSECNRSWTMRPPGLVAHKHYQLCVVAQAMSSFLFDPEATLTSVGSEHNCCRKTVKRWVCWTASIAEPKVVMQKVVQAVDSVVLPRLLPVSQLMRKAVTAIGREVVQRCAEVLSALECLCSAWHLEPPGLEAVFQHVVGDRSGIGTYARSSIPELVQSAG